MFRAIILPIFRITRLWVTACGIMHPRCCRPAGHRSATSWVHYTTSCNSQSSASEDGKNNCPKHVELTGIINKSLLLHLIGCLYYLYQWCTVKQISENEIYLLIKYIKGVLWRAVKRLSYIEEARCLKVKRASLWFLWYSLLQSDAAYHIMFHAHFLVPEPICCLKLYEISLKLYEISLSGTWAITRYKHNTMVSNRRQPNSDQYSMIWNAKHLAQRSPHSTHIYCKNIIKVFIVL